MVLVKAYVEEVYYTESYLLGRVAVISTVFPYYARMASMEIKARTFDNIDESNIPDEVKDCACEIAEYLYKVENEKRVDGIKSESVGEYSVTYEATTTTSDATKKSSITSICRKWLADTGLMYCGVV